MTTNNKSWSHRARMLAFVPLFSLVLPHLAAAQNVDTTHAVKINLKAAYQDLSTQGHWKIGKDSANEKDIFELCTDDAPTKTQGVFLFLNCDTLNMNRIVLANTDPISVIGDLGTIEFDEDNLVYSESNSGAWTKAILPAAVHLSCGGGSLEVEASGVATINYKALPGSTDVCPNSVTVQMTGRAEVVGQGFIVDVGSKLDAKNRSSAVSVP